jgi:hypothetical protein
LRYRFLFNHFPTLADEVLNPFLVDFSATHCAKLFFILNPGFFHILHFFAWITICFQDVIGKTDDDILSGEGIDKMNNAMREVMAKGIPTKREFVFDTPLFGEKTFVAYIEPVLSKLGQTIGVNYVAMDVTDQVMC